MDNSVDNVDLANIIENEGLDYAVTGYLSASSIIDKEIAQAWKLAADAMDVLERLLVSKGIIPSNY